MEYGQFCPIAKAAEVLGEKWTILILRELLYGSSRFNDFQAAIAGISPTMLTKRLRDLEIKGVVEKENHDYRLTECGQELAPLVRQYAIWGMRWARGDMPDDELDAQLLMYDMRRRINTEFLPPTGATIHIHFKDQAEASDWWLLVQGSVVELVDEEPEAEEDLLIESDLRSLTQLWLGDLSLRGALTRQLLRLKGKPLLIRCIEDWLPLARQAAIRPARPPHRQILPAAAVAAPPASPEPTPEPVVEKKAKPKTKAKTKSGRKKKAS